MRKPSKEGKAGGSDGGLLRSEFALAYPVLCEWMGTEKWEDGSARETTTLFLFVSGGWLKAMLKDRDQGMVAFYTADSLLGLLEAIERHLEAGTVEWKRDRPPAGRGRK